MASRLDLGRASKGLAIGQKKGNSHDFEKACRWLAKGQADMTSKGHANGSQSGKLKRSWLDFNKACKVFAKG